MKSQRAWRWRTWIRLPVVSDDGQHRLLGMLTRFDVVKALLDHYESDSVTERLLDLPLRSKRRAR